MTKKELDSLIESQIKKSLIEYTDEQGFERMTETSLEYISKNSDNIIRLCNNLKKLCNSTNEMATRKDLYRKELDGIEKISNNIRNFIKNAK